MILPPPDLVLGLWLGALTSTGITISARFTNQLSDVRLAVTGPGGTTFSAPISTNQNFATMTISGLSPDTEYSFVVQNNEIALKGRRGTFRTAPTGNASFTISFSGDADTPSNRPIFDTIVEQNPLLFIHLGDAHYNNIAINNPTAYRSGYDTIFTHSKQARLRREIPTVYVWDDHDFGPNNADASAVGKPSACSVYRERVPHYSLPHASAIYQTFDIGRVRFIITDQRSEASSQAATDNASKTMLGTDQKTWFKNLLSNSSGKLIVWVCPRIFGATATVGADHWGGFTTERTELVDHIKANCSGRVIVISADGHYLAIDDGTNHDFATGGGEPIKTFQAAPLDRDDASNPGFVYSEGVFTNKQQFGTMQVVDGGGSSLDVTWRGFNTAGTELTSLAFTVNL